MGSPVHPCATGTPPVGSPDVHSLAAPDTWRRAQFTIVFERETNSITEEAAARRAAAKASIERGGGTVTADRAHVVVARLGAVTAISAVRALEASGRRGTVERVDVVADVAGDLHAVRKDARPPGSKITALPSGGYAYRTGVAA